MEPNLRVEKIIRWISVAVLAVTAYQSAMAHAADTEYDVKAALLYKTFKFIHWPASAFSHPNAPLSVCILGDDPFGSTIDKISGMPIRKHAIEVKRFATLNGEESQCHVLFIAASEAERLNVILAAVRDKPVLTVAELPTFAQRGGVMKFTSRYNRIRFEINSDIGRQAGLTFSAQFMRMVTVVESTGGMDR